MQSCVAAKASTRLQQVNCSGDRATLGPRHRRSDHLVWYPRDCRAPLSLLSALLYVIPSKDISLIRPSPSIKSDASSHTACDASAPQSPQEDPRQLYVVAVPSSQRLRAATFGSLRTNTRTVNLSTTQDLRPPTTADNASSSTRLAPDNRHVRCLQKPQRAGSELNALLRHAHDVDCRIMKTD